MSSPALKKPLAALVPHPQRCRMAIPDPHFSRTEDGHKQGWPTRGGWRTPERGGGAASGRSPGAQSEPGGRAGAADPGQWGAPQRREPVVSGPPIAPRTPRTLAARRLPEGARGARQLSRRTPGTSLLPNGDAGSVLGFSRRILARPPLPWFLNLCPPNSVRSR